MNRYWLQKKEMAPGCEPLLVRQIMEVLQPHVYGQSLAGAGGGGFLCLLTKEPRNRVALQEILAEAAVGEHNPRIGQLLQRRGMLCRLGNDGEINTETS